MNNYLKLHIPSSKTESHVSRLISSFLKLDTGLVDHSLIAAAIAAFASTSLAILKTLRVNMTLRLSFLTPIRFLIFNYVKYLGVI